MSNVKRLEEAEAVVAANLTPTERERLEALSEEEVDVLIRKSRKEERTSTGKSGPNSGEQKRSYEEG